MRSKTFFLTSLSLVLLMLLVYGCGSDPNPDASVVWSDDFEDGDTEGWEQFGGEDKHFVSEGAVHFGTSGGVITHPSTVTTGTWSFDVFIPPEGLATNEIYFIASQPDTNLLAAFPITIEHRPDTIIEFNHLVGDEETVIGAVRISEGGRLSGWHHMDITRDDRGNVIVYFNKAFVYKFNQDFPYESDFFGFYTCCEGPALDNIVVRNQIIDILPTDND